MTSIEWLEQIAKSMVINGGDLGEDYPALMVHIQQSKQIHKQEMGDTWDAAIFRNAQRGYNASRTFEDFDDYYQETFVSKGNDDHISNISKMVEVPKQETLYTEEQVLDAIDNAIKGYNHNTYTEKQLREAIEMSKDIKFIAYSIDDIINLQSLKQPKKD